jgi:5'-3' exonuclease
MPKPAGFDEARSKFIEKAEWLLGIPQIIDDQLEADDLVASLVHSDRVAPKTYVVSGDKDLMQLAGCRGDIDVQYYCLNKKAVLQADDILARWSIKQPSHVAIALAILGDPGDGIPGIKGWGPVKVAKLFESVTPAMTFEQTVAVIDGQIPVKYKQIFYDCLEHTLLNKDAVIDYGPMAINWRHPSELADAGLEDLRDQYSTSYYAAVPVSDDIP